MSKKEIGSMECTSMQKYHIKKGDRMKKYTNVWNEARREYYKTLVSEYAHLWNNVNFMTCLVEHWPSFESR